MKIIKNVLDIEKAKFIKNTLTNSGEVKTKILIIPEAFTDSCKEEQKTQVETSSRRSSGSTRCALCFFELFRCC
jgi:hypothetical protein